MHGGAGTVASFVMERVRRAHGRRWDGGARVPPLALAGAAPEALACLMQRRARGAPDLAVRGRSGWWQPGRPADLTAAIPSADDVLHAQAAGRRFVSLVDDALARGHGDPRHLDGLSFALHALCHLEKFVDPEHAAGQRGFFRACVRLGDTRAGAKPRPGSMRPGAPIVTTCSPT